MVFEVEVGLVMLAYINELGQFFGISSFRQSCLRAYHILPLIALGLQSSLRCLRFSLGASNDCARKALPEDRIIVIGGHWGFGDLIICADSAGQTVESCFEMMLETLEMRQTPRVNGRLTSSPSIRSDPTSHLQLSKPINHYGRQDSCGLRYLRHRAVDRVHCQVAEEALRLRQSAVHLHGLETVPVRVYMETEQHG